jgi:hypothetical protein
MELEVSGGGTLRRDLCSSALIGTGSQNGVEERRRLLR